LAQGKKSNLLSTDKKKAENRVRKTCRRVSTYEAWCSTHSSAYQ
jgi:hypothetical protein